MWSLANWLKIAVICLCDLINQHYEPFDEFTRTADFKQPTEALQSKADRFEQILKEKFVVLETPEAVVWNYKRQLDGGYDLGDQAIWHGVTTYMLGLKYHKTGEDEDRVWFRKSVKGLYYHQKYGHLIRGVDPYGNFKEDASSDQLTGHLLGIYAAKKFGYEVEASQLLSSLVSRLLIHGDCITNLDSKITRFGRLTNGVLTDPLNLAVVLAAYKLNAPYSASSQMRYDELVRKYKPLLKYGHVSLLGWRKDYDEHRAAICHMILADLERDSELQHIYARALVRDWKRCRKSRNPWMYYMMRNIMLMDPNDASGCIQRLAEMEVEEKTKVIGRDNSEELKIVKYGGKIRSKQPIALWRRASQDFFWQRSQYGMNEHSGYTGNEIEHNGVDFLLVYWGFKNLGLLK